MKYYFNCLRCDSELPVRKVDFEKGKNIPINYQQDRFDLNKDAYFIRIVNDNVISTPILQAFYNSFTIKHEETRKTVEQNLQTDVEKWKNMVLNSELRTVQEMYAKDKFSIQDILKDISRSFDRHYSETETHRYAVDEKCGWDIMKYGKKANAPIYDYKKRITRGEFLVNVDMFKDLPEKIVKRVDRLIPPINEKYDYEARKIHLELMHFSQQRLRNPIKT